MRQKYMLCSVLFLSLVLAGCGGERALPETVEAEQTESAGAGAEPSGGELGVFEAKTLDGGTFTQEDIAKKDATLINFWATYCGPCLQEMPDIAKLAKELPDNVQIITVCLDGKAELAKEILEEAGFEGTTLISCSGALAEIAGQILYVPTTIVVDQEGNRIGDEIIGGQENLEDVFVSAINQALRAAGKAEIDYAEE